MIQIKDVCNNVMINGKQHKENEQRTNKILNIKS